MGSDIDVINITQWVRYIDNAGYIGYNEFMELPSGLPVYVSAIRITDELKKLRELLSETKDKDIRKKLSSNIRELEAFFNE